MNGTAKYFPNYDYISLTINENMLTYKLYMSNLIMPGIFSLPDNDVEFEMF